MPRHAKWIVLLSVVALVGAGCGGSGGQTAAPTTAAPTATTTVPTTASTTAAPTTAAPTTAAPTTTVAPTTTAGNPSGPAGGPVPAGFEVQSATFVSDNDGWVLGTAPCAAAPCTSMVRTTDGGTHWVGVPAPGDGLATTGTSTGVSEVRYADGSNGWVFAPDLWSTHNGGASWTAVQVGGATPFVEDLEAAGGLVDLVAASGCDPQTTPGCTVQLWQAVVGSDNFQPVPGVTLASGTTGRDALTLHGRTGYLLAEGQEGAPVPVLWRTTDGTHWTSGPSICPNNLEPASVAAVDNQRAAVLCVGDGAAGSTEKQLYATSDGGATFVSEGTRPPFGGDGGTVAAATVSTLAIATSSGAAEIYRTTDGGATWQTVLQLDDGGLGWGDFGFTDATHGFTVHGPAAFASSGSGLTDPGTLFMTSDGGASWQLVPISG